MASQISELCPTFVRMAVPRGRHESSTIFPGTPASASPPNDPGQSAREIYPRHRGPDPGADGAVTGGGPPPAPGDVRADPAASLIPGRNLAAVSEGYLLGYDAVQLEQAAEQVLSQALLARWPRPMRMWCMPWPTCATGWSPRSVGAVICRAKGSMIPSASGPSRRRDPLVQDIVIPESREPGYDVAIPVSPIRAPRNGARFAWDFPCSARMR